MVDLDHFHCIVELVRRRYGQVEFRQSGLETAVLLECCAAQEANGLLVLAERLGLLPNHSSQLRGILDVGEALHDLGGDIPDDQLLQLGGVRLRQDLRVR